MKNVLFLLMMRIIYKKKIFMFLKFYGFLRSIILYIGCDI